VIAVERRVKAAHLLACLVAVCVVVDADHDAIGTHEVIDGCALFQEFRVRHDREAVLRTAPEAALVQLLVDDGTHTLRGADGHRRLVDDHLEAVHRAADVARRFEHVLQVGGTVLVGRCAHRDELDFAVRDARRDIRRKRDASRRARTRDDLAQTRLVNRHAAVIQDFDLARVHVEAENVVADLGKTCARDETYVTRADHGDFHTLSGR
jgi:hypothetical protein